MISRIRSEQTNPVQQRSDVANHKDRLKPDCYQTVKGKADAEEISRRTLANGTRSRGPWTKTGALTPLQVTHATESRLRR